MPRSSSCDAGSRTSLIGRASSGFTVRLGDSKRRAAAGVFLFHPTAAGRGEHLVRTEVAAGIERFAEIFHSGQVGWREHLVHEADFFDADAMLAGNAAAASEALIEDLVARGQDALDLLRVALIEQQDRMNIAVAGVEHIHDADVVPGADL